MSIRTDSQRRQSKKARNANKQRRKLIDQRREQSETHEWQELRERILQRDNNRCVACGSGEGKMYAHHLLYEKGKPIWEVPDYYLVTLCHKCHKYEHYLHLSLPVRYYNADLHGRTP